MERNGDNVSSLDKNYDDSSSFDTYLHHFGDLIEVTVTDFPLTCHHDNTDHSYISTPKSRCSTTMYDCISEESLQSEFHELLDFGSDYPTFTFDLQEQIVESSSTNNSSTAVNDPRSDSGGCRLECVENEDDTSSGCETTDKCSIVNQELKQQNNHHTGPFPHNFIPVAGERRIKFYVGMQTIITKIKALTSRTGATAEFRAEFERHVFTLDNVEKMLKLPHRTKNNKRTTDHKKYDHMQMNDSSTIFNNVATNGGQDDHLYAATIVTQREHSSTIRDHQYNEVTNVGQIKDITVTKAYIPTRYARERWLRKGTTTIYTKIQRLINRTGAKMTLSITYQGILITSKNYRELDQMLEKYRSKLKKYHAEVIVQNDKDSDEKTFTATERRKQTVMTVSLPQKSKNHSVKIEFLKIDEDNCSLNDQTSRTNLQSVVESDHDYDSLCLHEQQKEAKKSIESISNLYNLSDDSSSPAQSHHNFSEAYSRPPSSVTSVEEISMSEYGDAIPSSAFGEYFSLCSSTPKSQCSTLQTATSSTMDASTSTDPCCGICGNSKVSLSQKGKFPNWIRCAQSLCHYLVHPYCIGFFVTNSQYLQFLPPYFCPSHREDGFS